MTRLLLAVLALACTLAACGSSGYDPRTLEGYRVHVRPQLDGARETRWQAAHIAWENIGAGPQALVFVHGWASDRSIWRKQLESLSPWRRIAIDLPGHGASDKPRIDYNADAMVDALRTVLDDADVERAVLVAHAEGGVTARRFLERYPGRVAGLILVDAPLKSRFDSAEQGRAFLKPLTGKGWLAWTAKLVDSMLAGMHDAAERKRLRALMLDTPQEVLLSSFEGTLDPALWRTEPIRVPLLLLLAKQPAWEGDYRAYAEKLAPGLRWEMLEGVSHFLMLDEPVKVDALVRSFLVEQAPFALR
jgi:pimeloyl-ACP methyl ester carboxylesterase